MAASGRLQQGIPTPLRNAVSLILQALLTLVVICWVLKVPLYIGAGIGGLTLALSLRKAGFSCAIFEAVSEIKPLGASINLLPHSVKVLDGLDLVPALSSAAVTTSKSKIYEKR